MPRTPYPEDEYNSVDANSQYEEYSVAKRQLANNMKVDNYTKGLLSSAQGSVAKSIAEQVRKRR